MKVLYIGHYKNGNTGWANASKNTISAMNRAGIDIVCRAIQTGNYVESITDEIRNLEQKSSVGCDICIQNVLPQFLEYNGNYKKNIAYCVYEMCGALMSTWASKINIMDELWTVTEYSKRCFESMGVTIPIKIVPYGFDRNLITPFSEKIEHPSLDGNYIFYTIADLNKRKDLLSTIRAFHTAFTPNEPVSLLIKTSKVGMSGYECAKAVIEDCKRVKHNMKLYKSIENYLEEVIIGDELPYEDVLKIHNTGDCYVCTSHGESWNVPLYESMAYFAHNAIYSKSHPFNDFVTNNLVYNDTTDCVFEMSDTFSDISSSRETWSIANIVDIAKQMRKSYELYQSNSMEQHSLTMKYASTLLDSFSYEKVGNLIKESLCI